MPNGKSQNQFVLDHIRQHGYITDTIARNYGIRRLASRIHDLKLANIVVDKSMKEDDAGVRYARYFAPPDRRAQWPQSFTVAMEVANRKRELERVNAALAQRDTALEAAYE